MSKALIDDLYNGLNTSDGKKVKEMFQNKLCEELYEIDGDLNTANTGIKARLSTVESDLNTANTGIKARVTTLESNKLDKGSYTGTAENLKQEIDIKAPISSPNFINNPTAPTPTFGDNDTSIATSAFVQEAIGTVINVVGNNGGSPVVIPASKPIGYIYEIRKTGTTGIVNITLADTNEKFTTGLLTQISLNSDGDFWKIKKVSATRWDLISGIQRGSNANGEWFLRADGVQECSLLKTVSIPISSYSVVGFAWTLPLAFNSVYFNAWAVFGPSASTDFYGHVYNDAITDGGIINMAAKNGATAQNIIRVSAIARGRWY